MVADGWNPADDLLSQSLGSLGLDDFAPGACQPGADVVSERTDIGSVVEPAEDNAPFALAGDGDATASLAGTKTLEGREFAAVGVGASCHLGDNGREKGLPSACPITTTIGIRVGAAKADM